MGRFLNPKETKLFFLILTVSFSILGFFWIKLAMALTMLTGLLVALNEFGVFNKIYTKKMFKKMFLKKELYDMTKTSKNTTHSLLIVGKYIFGIPMKENEDEITSYLDIKQKVGSKWPFMMPVGKTGQELMTVQGKPARCFSSYSYLNLNRDPRVQEAAIKAAQAYSTGNVGPRMLCGNLEILEELERMISKFFKKEATLVFSAGFLACMSSICGLARKGDLVLMDKLCHASLKTGAKLCGGKVVYFNHNDFNHAEELIKKHSKLRLIMVIEGIYSMDGDIGSLPEARKLCDKYKGCLILDEAHSIGAVGKTGRGTEELHNYTALADIICGTFSKSIASVGGYISTTQRLRDFYALYAPGVLFSAPLSAYHAGAAMKAFEILIENPQLVTQVQKNGDYLRKRFKENGFNIGHTTTVVIPVIFEDLDQCFLMHEYLLKKGFYTACVMAPACPVNAPRFRITCTTSQTQEDLENLVQTFIEAREKCPVSETFKALKELF